MAAGDGLFGFQRWERTAVSLADGEARWQEKVDGQVIAVGEQLVILDQKAGALRLAEASTEAYAATWEKKVFEAERVETPLAFQDGVLYVRTPSELIALKAQTAPGGSKASGASE